MSRRAKSKATDCNLEITNQIQQQIFVARGLRVMLDSDLAKLYGVTTKHLNQQYKRNLKRFPEDFAFRLTLPEANKIACLRSQFVTLNRGQHIKHPPRVFTEHGAIMLASVLKSRVAVQASIFVVRAFIQMRAAMLEYADLSRRVDELAATYDHRFQQVFIAIRNLMARPQESRRAIGFVGDGKRRRNEKP